MEVVDPNSDLKIVETNFGTAKSLDDLTIVETNLDQSRDSDKDVFEDASDVWFTNIPEKKVENSHSKPASVKIAKDILQGREHGTPVKRLLSKGVVENPEKKQGKIPHNGVLGGHQGKSQQYKLSQTPQNGPPDKDFREIYQKENNNRQENSKHKQNKADVLANGRGDKHAESDATSRKDSGRHKDSLSHKRISNGLSQKDTAFRKHTKSDGQPVHASLDAPSEKDFERILDELNGESPLLWDKNEDIFGDKSKRQFPHKTKDVSEAADSLPRNIQEFSRNSFNRNAEDVLQMSPNGWSRSTENMMDTAGVCGDEDGLTQRETTDANDSSDILQNILVELQSLTSDSDMATSEGSLSDSTCTAEGRNSSPEFEFYDNVFDNGDDEIFSLTGGLDNYGYIDPVTGYQNIVWGDYQTGTDSGDFTWDDVIARGGYQSMNRPLNRFPSRQRVCTLPSISEHSSTDSETDDRESSPRDQGLGRKSSSLSSVLASSSSEEEGDNSSEPDSPQDDFMEKYPAYQYEGNANEFTPLMHPDTVITMDVADPIVGRNMAGIVDQKDKIHIPDSDNDSPDEEMGNYRVMTTAEVHPESNSRPRRPGELSRDWSVPNSARPTSNHFSGDVTRKQSESPVPRVDNPIGKVNKREVVNANFPQSYLPAQTPVRKLLAAHHFPYRVTAPQLLLATLASSGIPAAGSHSNHVPSFRHDVTRSGVETKPDPSATTTAAVSNTTTSISNSSDDKNNNNKNKNSSLDNSLSDLQDMADSIQIRKGPTVILDMDDFDKPKKITQNGTTAPAHTTNRSPSKLWNVPLLPSENKSVLHSGADHLTPARGQMPSRTMNSVSSGKGHVVGSQNSASASARVEEMDALRCKIVIENEAKPGTETRVAGQHRAMASCNNNNNNNNNINSSGTSQHLSPKGEVQNGVRNRNSSIYNHHNHNNNSNTRTSQNLAQRGEFRDAAKKTTDRAQGKTQKGKEHADGAKNFNAKTDDVKLNLSHASSGEELSVAGDRCSRKSFYLADTEDTETSFDDAVKRDKTRGMEKEGSGIPMSPLSQQSSMTSDDVFKPGTSSTKQGTQPDGTFMPEVLKNSMMIILSGIYGIVLVVLGLVLPISETFSNPKHPYFFELYYLYLYVISMVFLVYVYTYLLRKEKISLLNLPRNISRTLSRTFSRSSQRSRQSSGEKGGPTVVRPLVRRNNSIISSGSNKGRKKKIAYNPNTSNHTGSFYLRVGVIGFGIGAMIHSGLTFGHYFEINHLANHCGDVIQAIKPFAHLCFTFVQMYFVFMNSKMCVHKYKSLARFGLMHMSCTNICVWLRSIVVETILVIQMDDKRTFEALVKAYAQKKNNTLVADGGMMNKQEIQEFLDENKMGSLPELDCSYNTMMGKLVEKSSVYLYPCTIEYSLVCACVLYVMWSNVGEANTGKRMYDSCSDINVLDGDSSGEDSNDDNGTHRMSVDCAGSSKGLFFGIFLFVAAVVLLICYYVLINTDKHITSGTLLGYISEDVIYVVAFAATALAGFQMRFMNYTSKRDVGLEEILSIISLSGLGLYCMFSIVAAIFYLDTLDGALTISTNMLMFFQAATQACFTMTALRASAASSEQIRKKPGRQCVTFLLICNFALWAINTFETQRLEHNVIQVDFYGTTAWAIFGHISVPLGIYFRFHSTVNLSIVWKKAWKMKHAVAH